MTVMTELDKLLERLGVYSVSDRRAFDRIQYQNVENLTDKAVRLDGQWWPLSQLRCDVDGNLYAAKWLIAKKRDEAIPTRDAKQQSLSDPPEEANWPF